MPGTICMVTILQLQGKEKYFSRYFPPFHSIHICYRVCLASHAKVSVAVSLTEQYSTCCINQNNFLHIVPTIRAH